MFVDSDHAYVIVPCRSRSVFLIHWNATLVQWFSKKQSTVETSFFKTEFVTMKQNIKALRGLRMIDIHVSGPHVFMGVICQLCMMHQDKNHFSERKATQFAFMQFIYKFK